MTGCGWRWFAAVDRLHVGGAGDYPGQRYVDRLTIGDAPIALQAALDLQLGDCTMEAQSGSGSPKRVTTDIG